MEIKLERFDCSDAWGMESAPEGEYVRFEDVLSALKGLIAITDAQLTAAFDDGRVEGYEEGYRNGQAWEPEQ